MRLYRSTSRSVIPLGQKLGKGGEGTVHDVRGAPNVVAKIYQKPPSARKAEKLAAMMRSANAALLRVAAWPTDVLYDEQGVVRGFLMPRVTSRHDVHELYNPKSRAQKFPRADFRFVVRAATNVARAFAVVHSQGHVIGDVNHGNALIGNDATVVLIDCDSFQIRDRERTYGCDVGVPLFTSPELQNKSFRGLRRTRNHDAFGLAILIFHLLYMGRHPFAGRMIDGSEKSIEAAIVECRFAYGADPTLTGMQRPPGTLELNAFGEEIADLFSHAFARDSSIQPRPSAASWVEALARLEANLIACARSDEHLYRRGTDCPWCDLEQQVRAPVFVRQAATLVGSEIALLWNRIQEIEPPAAWSQPPTLASDPSRAGASWRYFILFAGIGVGMMQSIAGAILIITMTVVAFFGLGGFGTSRREVKVAQAQLEQLLSQWQAVGSDEKFERVRTELREARDALLELIASGPERMRFVTTLREEFQRERFLRQFRVDDVFGETLKGEYLMTLATKGIHTAADLYRTTVNPDSLLPREISEQLRSWYEQCVDRFQFDPETRPDSNEAAHIHRQLEQRREWLVRRLRQGPEELRDARAEIVKDRIAYQERVSAVRKSLAAAHSNG